MQRSPAPGHRRRTLLVAIGVDCDPDREAYPGLLRWRGVEALPHLFGIEGVKWTMNVRADTQVRDYCGSAGYCHERYADIWKLARSRGSEIAWHLHYFGADGRQDVSEANVRENVRVGAEAIGPPPVVHMGWTFQNEFSIRELARVGVRVDYSPVPRLAFSGRSGTDAYDWADFAYRPQGWHGVRMIPAYSYADRTLSRRFGTERVMLTTTTTPFLYRRLLRSFFETGSDFFVSYFHADEIAGAVGGWRDHLYTFENLRTNVTTLQLMAARRGYDVRFVTISELADALFDERRSRYA
jgi:hypothetical protein